MASSSMFILCVILLSISSAAHADTIWGSCDGIGISFKLFTLFPNPVAVGQIVDGNAVISLQNNVKPGDIKSGTISVEITYNKGYTFTLPNIPLCDSTNAIVCNTLSHGDNTISFSYRVPKIPAGTYSIRITAIINGASIQTSCLTFELTVTDPSQNGLFHSFIEAHLRGQAQFENPNYLARGLGDVVQVGPIGPVPTVYSKLFEWGTFMSVTGSEDVVSSYFNPANFVWGLNGTMVVMRYLNSTRQQTYTGDFTIGYVSDIAERTMDLELIDGTFNLTWSYTTDANGKVSSTLAGTLIFSHVASLPSGWSYPITLGRFAELDAVTNDLGILVVTASTDYCSNPSACPVPSTSVVAPPSNNKKSSTPLSARNLGLIIGLGVGGFLVLILIIALIIWRRYRQRNNEEDGIFSAARKPEYGNALVVDDIIQETKERGGDNALIPRLAKRPEDEPHSEYSSEEDVSRRGGRGRERSPSIGTRSASLSEDDDDDRSRPPPRYRSKSRGSRSEDDYSRSDAGSSASRSDDEDDR